MKKHLWRGLLPLFAILCLAGCKDRQMSAECKAILQLPPPALFALETSSTVVGEDVREWTISKFNPGHLPLVIDVSLDTSGLATAPLLQIEPGGRKVVFAGKRPTSVTSLQLALPSIAFTRAMPAVGKPRPSVTLLFPVDPKVATFSQTPRDGAGFMRSPSHTAERGGQSEAVDIDAPLGTLILAPADGVVAHAYDASPDVPCDFVSHSAYANNLMLVTDDDVTLLLGHLFNESILVEAGTRVRRGQPIARVGHSGSGDRAHLHLVAMALGPDGVDSIPIRFAACDGAAEVWTPRNGRPRC